MPETIAFIARVPGCDATHRASKLDTHLTHGCIQCLRHFSRVRRECLKSTAQKSAVSARFSESAQRTREGAAS